MSVEAILQQLEKFLGELDERTKEAVKLALELSRQAKPAQREEPQWQGENPPFEETAKLEMMERSKVMWELERSNREWLLWQCEKLQAGWLIVVDGKVYRYGKGWANFIGDAEKLQIAKQTGKMPLLFVHRKMLLIEETAWMPLDTEDAYPTLPFILSGDGKRLELVGDWDTGATGIFTDADTLSATGIVHFAPTDQWLVDVHLGETFVYCTKALTVILRANDGTERVEYNFGVACVLNWQQSPFVSVNPNRTSLVGRDVCFRLKPKVTLDFSNRQTSISF